MPTETQEAKFKQPCLDAEFEDHQLKQSQTNKPTERDKWKLFGFVY